MWRYKIFAHYNAFKFLFPEQIMKKLNEDVGKDVEFQNFPLRKFC